MNQKDKGAYFDRLCGVKREREASVLHELNHIIFTKSFFQNTPSPGTEPTPLHFGMPDVLTTQTSPQMLTQQIKAILQHFDPRLNILSFEIEKNKNKINFSFRIPNSDDFSRNCPQNFCSRTRKNDAK